jgi:hypothetical protein
MRRLLLAVTILGLLAACSGDGGDATTTSEAPGTTTTSEQATTTTTLLPTTTTIPPSTSSTEADPLAPEGSGCTPETAELPDGEWYGQVDDFDATGISFDLACWFTGEAADVAADEDGEESPPPNDYYVRNENDEVRLLTVTVDTPVTWYPSGDPNDVVDGTFADWTEYLESQEFRLGIWVTVLGGQVTEIVEQWVP